MYLLLNQLYGVTHYLFHFGSKYSHLHPVLQHLELMCLMSETKFHTHTKLDKIIANVYALIQKMGKKIDSELKGTKDLRNIIS